MELCAHTFVEGSSLSTLIFEVRERFLSQYPYMLDEARTPNSLQVMASETVSDLTAEERVAVLSDLVTGNKELTFRRPVGQIFETAATPAEILVDLICEVICEILRRDPSLRAEDEWRIRAATASLEELEQRQQPDDLPPHDL